MAGKSTLNRLEHCPEDVEQGGDSRYHKIGHSPEEIESLFVKIFLESYSREPREIILDLDVKEEIILTLVYLRHLTTFQLLGIQFGVSESKTFDTFNSWLPILRELFLDKPLANDLINRRFHESSSNGFAANRRLYCRCGF